jgi:hypothetical protein
MDNRVATKVVGEPMVARYKRSVDEPDECTYDILWTDRLTGKIVLSYDGADPANTRPSHGGCSDVEHFRRMGLDINAEIQFSKVIGPSDPREPSRWEARKRSILQRGQEDREARDLVTFLGKNVWKDFDFQRFTDGERNILAPALKQRGFTNIAFYMMEEDSFGPLVRGCVGTTKGGKRVRFYYG